MSAISDSQISFAPYSKAYNTSAADYVAAAGVASAIVLQIPNVPTAGWYNVAFTGQITTLTNNLLTGFTFNLYSDAAGATLLAAINFPLITANRIGTSWRFNQTATAYFPAGAVYCSFKPIGSAATITHALFDPVAGTGVDFSWQAQI
jgi:hypothetical protein